VTSPRTANEQVARDWGGKEVKKSHEDRMGGLLRKMKDGSVLERGSGTTAICEMGLKSGDGAI
jgi:hypothetical protein